MTRTEALALVKCLQGAYPRTEFTEDNARVYAQMLADLPVGPATQAVHRLAMTNKWLPTIAEIRQAVVTVVNPLPAAEDAWEEAQRVARHWCPYERKQPEFTHPLVQRAVKVMGGIRVLAESTDRTWTGREFRRVYESLREQDYDRRKALPGGGPANMRMVTGGEGDGASVARRIRESDETPV